MRHSVGFQKACLFVVWYTLVISMYSLGPAQFDELLMLDIVLNTEFKSMIEVLLFREFQMPLSYFWTKTISLFASDQLVLLRMPSFLFTLITPFVIYCWCRCKAGFNKAKAVEVSLLSSFSFPILYYSDSLRPYTSFVFLYVVFLSQLEVPGKEFNRKWPIILSGVLCFLIHPAGMLAMAIALSFFALARKKNNALIKWLVILVGLFCVILFLRWDDISVLVFTDNLKSRLINTVEALGFIFSGRYFFLSFVVLTAVWCLLSSRELVKKRLKEFDFYVLSVGILSIVILGFIFPGSIKGRHFIFMVPLVAFCTVRMIHDLKAGGTLKKILTYSFLSLLILKSFAVEGIHKKYRNLSSAELVHYAFDYSSYMQKVVSCGNCPSFYIRDSRLVCLGDWLDVKSLQSLGNEFVFIEYDKIQNACRVESIKADYKVEKSKKVQGATLYYISRR